MRKILVTGAGGFIGWHLVHYLLKERGDCWIRGVDIKQPEFALSEADEFIQLDLRDPIMAELALRHDFDDVYALAADMGGMGFIASHHAQILHNNLTINLNTLEAARKAGVKRYLFTSSACVYPEYLQGITDVTPLKESDAYPADPQDAYGWEKLTTEKLVTHYGAEYGIDTRIVRFHNIFGEEGTWRGGREKAPAALCRKIAEAKRSGYHEIEVWGDGEQTRSFCYVNDCVKGIVRLMDSGFTQPLNLGSDRMVTINELVQIIADIAGIPITINHVDGPQGVRGRNSDNTLLRQTLNWEPQISLENGLRETYTWIEAQVNEQMRPVTGDPTYINRLYEFLQQSDLVELVNRTSEHGLQYRLIPGMAYLSFEERLTKELS